MFCRLGTLEERASMLGCSRTLIALWDSGQRVPSMHWRVSIRDLFSIAIALWDLPIQSPLSPVLSIRAQVLRAIEGEEERKRVDAILRRNGVP